MHQDMVSKYQFSQTDSKHMFLETHMG
jgi:hypothetical protein